MAKTMLIDASHLEETRVVVLSGNRLEEFDFESAARTQLKGNIYLAKITRVEPSLQAAFVEYGGNRHGFLPFSEIHPDYYRIPIADREALIAEEVRLGRETARDDQDLDEDRSGSEVEAEGEAEEAADEAAAESDGGEAAAKVEEVEVEDSVDTVGGDEVEDDARKRARLMRRYKIQEVIKRRQVMLVQVTKEERGNKGAALTTYLSLAGRYCVLMPNTGRGGGISRKIGSATDRRRLKKVVSELDIPDGMAVIVRTAGSERSKVEIRRDYEYLMRLWSEIRESTLQSTAPALIYEEANLIKRAIRDLYSSDMEEVLVDGEAGYKAVKAFMKSLIPSHARKIQFYKDEGAPIFHRYKIESQLDAMHSSSVQLKSGGYIVINPTEALVAIDVNSGKATRERHIEETALKTNIEAAEEVARQLRLRDLAGLIVIDFIDMEENRHNRDVERRFKEAMRHDRARIQFGRISPFGLLEMSRQRLRPSLFESSTVPCNRCGGTGHVRSTYSTARHVLRGLEEEGVRRGGGEILIALPTAVAFYILNDLRSRLSGIESRYEMRVRIERDDNLIAPDYRLDRLSSSGKSGVGDMPDIGAADEAEEDGRRRRGRRRRRRKDVTDDAAIEAPTAEASEAGDDAEPTEEALAADGAGGEAEERQKLRRRRGKRGGRRRSKRRRDGEAGEEAAPAAAAQSETQTESQPSAPAEGESAGAPEAAPEAGPARKPRRRTRKKPTAEAEPETAAQQTEAGQQAAEPAEEAPAEPETKTGKPRRSKAAAGGARKKAPSRSRKKPAKDKPEAETADVPAAEPVHAKAGTGGASPVRAGSDHDGEAKPAVQANEAPTTPPAHGARPDAAAALGHQVSPGASNDPDQAKRRGWWQRWV